MIQCIYCGFKNIGSTKVCKLCKRPLPVPPVEDDNEPIEEGIVEKSPKEPEISFTPFEQSPAFKNKAPKQEDELVSNAQNEEMVLKINALIRKQLIGKFQSLSEPRCPTCHALIPEIDAICPTCGADNAKVSQHIRMAVIDDAKPSKKNLSESSAKNSIPIEMLMPAKEMKLEEEIAQIVGKVYFRVGDNILSKNNNYTIVSNLGEGGFAQVYEVVSKQGKHFALKLLELWKFDDSVHHKLVSQFKREFKTGQLLSNYIVQHYDSGAIEGNPFIVMQYCNKGCLRKMILQKRFNEQEIIDITLKIVNGLSILHQNNIIHRDLKPGNILFDADDNVLLSDFGLVAFMNARETVVNASGRVNDLWGTRLYMPPEQLDLSRAYSSVNFSTDIFSLGVTLYETLTNGKMPFGKFDDNYATRLVNAQWVPLRNLRPDISERFEQIIFKCIQPRIGNRYQNTDQILADLEQLIADKKAVNEKKPIMPTTELPSYKKNIDEKKPIDVPKNEAAKENNNRANDSNDDDSERNTNFVVNVNIKQLRIIAGDTIDKVYILEELLKTKPDNILTIGWYNPTRIHANDIELIEQFTSTVSSYHAVLQYLNGIWYIKDGQYREKKGISAWYKSTNGVYINNSKIGEYKYTIRKGDIITIGNIQLLVE